MLERQRIIILKTMKYRDADLIVTGLSSEGRRTSYIARSALKSKKRFGGGVLEPIHFVDAVVKKNAQEGRWPELQEAQIIKSFDGVRTSFANLQEVFTLMDWVLRLIPDGGESKDAFALLGRALETFQSCALPAELRRLAQLKLLALHGILPSNDQWLQWLRLPLAEHSHLAMGDAAAQEFDDALKIIFQDYAGQY